MLSAPYSRAGITLLWVAVRKTVVGICFILQRIVRSIRALCTLQWSKAQASDDVDGNPSVGGPNEQKG